MIVQFELLNCLLKKKKPNNQPIHLTNNEFLL